MNKRPNPFQQPYPPPPQQQQQQPQPPQPPQPPYGGYWVGPQGQVQWPQQPPQPAQQPPPPPQPTPEQAALYANYGYGGQQSWVHHQPPVYYAQQQQQQQPPPPPQQPPYPQPYAHAPPPMYGQPRPPYPPQPHPHAPPPQPRQAPHVPQYGPHIPVPPGPQPAQPYYPQPPPQPPQKPAQPPPQIHIPYNPANNPPQHGVHHTPPHNFPPAKRPRFDAPTTPTHGGYGGQQQQQMGQSQGLGRGGGGGPDRGMGRGGGGAIGMRGGRGGGMGRGGIGGGGRGGGINAGGMSAGGAMGRGGGKAMGASMHGDPHNRSTPRGPSYRHQQNMMNQKSNNVNNSNQFSRSQSWHPHSHGPMPPSAPAARRATPRRDDSSNPASGSALNAGASGSGAAFSASNKRTLTDFRIIGLACKEMDWSWGSVPSSSSSKEKEKSDSANADDEPAEDKEKGNDIDDANADDKSNDKETNNHDDDSMDAQSSSDPAPNSTSEKEKEADADRKKEISKDKGKGKEREKEHALPAHPSPVAKFREASFPTLNNRPADSSRIRIYFHSPVELEEAQIHRLSVRGGDTALAGGSGSGSGGGNAGSVNGTGGSGGGTTTTTARGKRKKEYEEGEPEEGGKRKKEDASGDENPPFHNLDGAREVVSADNENAGDDGGAQTIREDAEVPKGEKSALDDGEGEGEGLPVHAEDELQLDTNTSTVDSSTSSPTLSLDPNNPGAAPESESDPSSRAQVQAHTTAAHPSDASDAPAAHEYTAFGQEGDLDEAEEGEIYHFQSPSARLSDLDAVFDELDVERFGEGDANAALSLGLGVEGGAAVEGQTPVLPLLGLPPPVVVKQEQEQVREGGQGVKLEGEDDAALRVINEEETAGAVKREIEDGDRGVKVEAIENADHGEEGEIKAESQGDPMPPPNDPSQGSTIPPQPIITLLGPPTSQENNAESSEVAIESRTSSEGSTLKSSTTLVPPSPASFALSASNSVPIFFGRNNIESTFGTTFPSTTTLSTASTSSTSNVNVNGKLAGLKARSGVTTPLPNRISISYAGSSRRIVLDADVVEKIRIFRRLGKIEVRLVLERALTSVGAGADGAVEDGGSKDEHAAVTEKESGVDGGDGSVAQGVVDGSGVDNDGEGDTMNVMADKEETAEEDAVCSALAPAGDGDADEPSSGNMGSSEELTVDGAGPLLPAGESGPATAADGGGCGDVGDSSGDDERSSKSAVACAIQGGQCRGILASLASFFSVPKLAALTGRRSSKAKLTIPPPFFSFSRPLYMPCCACSCPNGLPGVVGFGPGYGSMIPSLIVLSR
ncbi:hypothetical protein BOTBODRAFT_263015 [Botryobasidium botryosum FD-172 SS1]|uniref:Uncharacterized protein n=1 Tax=Botryobasidium botryosum (strain FD-172 SS1) TaxID=930990 RepID=A0A067M3V2_BOTB1|nr:hypothetical protein BOTBODRAFT_263015 [Botryobasidium botryosum FD-172 SS1]